LEPEAVQRFGLGSARVALVLGYDPAAYSSPPVGWADLFDAQRFPGARALRRSPRGTRRSPCGTRRYHARWL